jgi:alkylhydroperoxidase family enzyme
MLASVFVVIAGTLCMSGSPAVAQPGTRAPRFPALGTDEAWHMLQGGNTALPAWALVLAQPLPRTTGAMLHLDYMHRAKNPLGPVLASKLHWAAADTIGSVYSQRYAEADLRRAGVKDEAIQQMAGDPKKLPYADRIALAFARKMTKAAYTVTDAEVAELLQEFGPEKVVAMVHTLAWANFQNRIILALAVEVERDGPLAPLDPQLDAERQATLVAPARPPWKDAQAAPTAAANIGRPDWRKLTDSDLETALEEQKARKSRIPLPQAEPGTKAPSKVLWNQVSSGYQPLLTKAWSDTTRAFQQEAKLDRVFANTFFWVVTRTNECFY